MHRLLERIGEVAEKIKNIEGNREQLGKFLRDVKERIVLEGQEVLENRLIYNVTEDKLRKKKIIGIDGGISQHAYHGVDLILTRAVAAVFDYTEGKLVNVGYFPHSLVSPKLTVVSDPYSDEEFVISSSLERQKTEVDLAVQVFNEFSPDLVLMDGSIIPHGNDKPSQTSSAWERYEAVLRSFADLYNISNNRLAGCVEDSRGRRFCEIISKRILGQIDDPRIPQLQKILSGTRDTNLLYHVLERGERTCVFRYSSKPKDHSILSDLGPHGEKIYTFYLKTAEFDRPVRIDFFADENPIQVANEIASSILSVSCHSSYGIPAPIIEADLRAKLQERDANELHDQLVDRVGITPSLMKLRREQRPF